MRRGRDGRARGLAALSRGFIAAGAGNVRAARRAAAEAHKSVPHEPLAMLLRAQAAQIGGDGAAAQAAFHDMAGRDDTRLLGLRGLFVEATRRGDTEAARHYAQQAHGLQPLPWSAKAALDHRASESDWRGALRVLDTTIAAKLIDAATGQRQRAVLTTAVARDLETTAPDEALQLARDALRGAPDLVPAAALAARLLARRGDLRKAAKLIERTWTRADHPDLAQVYLNLRVGDSNNDRLARAQTLFRLARDSAEGRLMVAEAALATRDVALARATLAPLLDDPLRPSVRTCLLLAEIEETENGTTGKVREWLARASRAPRDPVWMADGIAYDVWMPVSPTTGEIDAVKWQKPIERLSPAVEGTTQPSLGHPIEEAPPTLPAIAAVPEQPLADAELVGSPLEAEAPPPLPPDPAAPAAPNAEPGPPEPHPPAPVELRPLAFPHSGAPDDPGPAAAEELGPTPRSRRSVRSSS